MIEQLLSEEEAVAKVRVAVLDIQGERWMAAFWKVSEKEGKSTLDFVGRVSWRFPVDDLPKCVEMLRADVEREMLAAKPPVPAPLDVADWLKPRKKEVECEEPDEIAKLFDPGERGEPRCGGE